MIALNPVDIEPAILRASLAILGCIFAAAFSRVFYCLYLHPLSRFPGPWYTASSSLFIAIISIAKKEPEFFTYLVRKYGSSGPIRISPTMLMFPNPGALKDIYFDPKCNLKSDFYGTGALGPPALFSTLDGEQHRQLRWALSNAPWTIGKLKNTWEQRFDDQVKLFTRRMTEHAEARRIVCLSDKVAEFAADIMSMISFTHAFGCVENQRDEKEILSNWRKGLTFFGFAARFRFFRERILKLPIVGLWFMPKISDDSGMGWLMSEANRQVTAREDQNAKTPFEGKPDFLQHCLDARFPDGSPLTPMQKRAHVTLLIQAGADTTATALGSTLRFILLNPAALTRARAEIDTAEQGNLLSAPVQYEETRQHLPYIGACIREGLRLHPPATNLFARVTPKGGKTIDGVFVPGGTEITSHAYVVQRDRSLYGDDADQFRPERWLESEKRWFQLEASQFVFGAGPRVCIGKDIALMELHKLIAETIRHFDIEVSEHGKYVVSGGVAYNQRFMGKFKVRKASNKM